MDISRSKILFPASPLIIKNTFSVPEELSQKYREYSEERVVQNFTEADVEKKEEFFKTCFKPDTYLKHYTYPIDVEEFNEETQCITTLLSQFLGMDTDKYVTESMMILLFTLSTCPVNSEDPIQSIQVSFLKFDEFLVENFHSQLVDFPNTRTFRFRSYLLRMFLSFNEENLQLP